MLSDEQCNKFRLLFFPPKQLSDIEAMNDDDLLEGYRLGINNGPEPKDNRDKWQGWRNGMCDIGRKITDDGQRGIAREFLNGA